MSAVIQRKMEFFLWPRSNLLLLLFLIGLGWFYSWRPEGRWSEVLTRHQAGLYHELTDAFLSGRVALSAVPDAALVNLSNPYDPSANAAWRRNDLSYFKGRYYLYHSAVPVVVLFIPVKLITGRYLSEDAAVAIFCFVGAASGICCLWMLRRDYFPQSPAVLLLLCGFAFGLGSAQFSVLRNSSANHVAIACASCFLFLAFFTAICSQRVGSSAAIWLALTGLFQALAAVSRPNLIFGTIGVFIILLGFIRSVQGRISLPTRFPILVTALLVPIVAVGGLSAWYNFERFETPFDFGARYMLGAWDQTHLAVAHLTGARENAWNYFLAVGEYRRYFPFVSALTWRAIGIIPHMPFLLFAFLFLWPGLRRPAALTAYVAFVLFANILSLVVLPSGNESAVLTSANSRYMFDFVPVFSFFSCIAVLAAGDAFYSRVRVQHAFIAAVAFFVTWSIIANLSFDFQRIPAENYRLLAQILDEPAALYEQTRGQHYGAVSIDAKFPSGLTGQTDPLVFTGSKGNADLLYITYTSQTTAAFGLASDGIEGPHGSPIAIDYSKIHRIQIWMGSLYPPIGHPAVSRMSTSAIIIAKRHLHVVVDGHIALDNIAIGHEALPAQVRLGINAGDISYCSNVFRGTIVNVDRLPLEGDQEQVPSPAYGDVHLLVRLPSGRTGVGEPLVVTGAPSAGDFVYVLYLAADCIQIGFDHWGYPGLLSKPIYLNFAIPHSFDIGMSSLYPTNGTRRGIHVMLDGYPILTSDRNTYDSSPYEVAVGCNPIGGSSCAYGFTGTILKVSRILSE